MNSLPATLEDVRYAYRLFLEREPDPIGLAHFRNELEQRSLGSGELGKAFLGSAEFTALNDIAPVEVELDGYSVFVRPDDQDIGQHIRATHQYEPHVTAVLRTQLQKGGVFLDVGANIGFFTSLAAHLVGDAGLVVAVEPLDKNLQLIYRSIARNGFENVRVYGCAASDIEETVCIATGVGTSNGQVMSSVQGKQALLYTQTKRLDEFLPDMPRIDLIKLDIEGYELRAWRGFQRALGRHRPAILTEFHPYCMRTYAGVEPMDYLGELFDYARDLQILPHQGGAIKCSTPAEVMQQWEIADKSMRGDGTHHLDLFVDSRR